MDEDEARSLEKALCSQARPAILLVGDLKGRPKWSWHALAAFMSASDNRPKPRSLTRYSIVIVADDVGDLMQDAVREAASTTAYFLAGVSVDEVGAVLRPFLDNWDKQNAPRRVVRHNLNDDDDDDDDFEMDTGAVPEPDEESAEKLLETLDVPVEDDGTELIDLLSGDEADPELKHPARPEEDGMSLDEVRKKLRRALDVIDVNYKSKQLAVFGVFGANPITGYRFIELLDVTDTPVTPGNKLMKRVSVAVVLTECNIGAQHVQDDIKSCIRNSGGVEWVQGVTREDFLQILGEVCGLPSDPVEEEEEESAAPVAASAAPAAAARSALPRRSTGRVSPEELKGDVSRPDFPKLDKSQFPSESGWSHREFVSAQIKSLPHGMSVNEIGRELFRRATLVGRSTTEGGITQTFRKHLDEHPETERTLEIVNVQFVPRSGRYIVTPRHGKRVTSPVSSDADNDDRSADPEPPAPVAARTTPLAPSPAVLKESVPAPAPAPIPAPPTPSTPTQTTLSLPEELTQQLLFIAGATVRAEHQRLSQENSDLRGRVSLFEAFLAANPGIRDGFEAFQKAQQL